jgi:hypothetical protein
MKPKSIPRLACYFFIAFTSPIASAELIYMGPYYDEAVYHACVESGLGKATTPQAVAALKAACTYKATPKKCRQYMPQPYVTWAGQTFGNCMSECLEASYYSKTFGECRTG